MLKCDSVYETAVIELNYVSYQQFQNIKDICSYALEGDVPFMYQKYFNVNVPFFRVKKN